MSEGIRWNPNLKKEDLVPASLVRSAELVESVSAQYAELCSNLGIDSDKEPNVKELLDRVVVPEGYVGDFYKDFDGYKGFELTGVHSGIYVTANLDMDQYKRTVFIGKPGVRVVCKVHSKFLMVDEGRPTGIYKSFPGGCFDDFLNASGGSVDKFMNGLLGVAKEELSQEVGVNPALVDFTYLGSANPMAAYNSTFVYSVFCKLDSELYENSSDLSEEYGEILYGADLYGWKDIWNLYQKGQIDGESMHGLFASTSVFRLLNFLLSLR